MSTENLKQQVIQELHFHQQEVERLTKVLALLDDIGVPAVPEGTLKMYKKRHQTPESRARISAYQQERQKRLRSEKVTKLKEEIASGTMSLKHLSLKDRKLLESQKEQGVGSGGSASDAGLVGTAGNWNPVNSVNPVRPKGE